MYPLPGSVISNPTILAVLFISPYKSSGSSLSKNLPKRILPAPPSPSPPNI